MTDDDSVSADKDFLYKQSRDFLLLGDVECIGPGVQLGTKLRQRFHHT
jgi:hypothetical protein